ncbi:MAG: magnesium/cobalt transporter CorA [Candidatus Altiarchaeales archaeon]|nr:magnesium/cobalt transporter CorA [Candidatus Altiarchaeota archaeon]MCG2783291.1 magnesium/cobalt transporter CorA [Candidatus Altiarchaeales archaeon]MBU4265853.1 magnesium/cobalt transporter CorA [Candidatus Altiarchaeota archaeon]MBU4341296.1 magnesium/cobalt transporter CorA [Candidatus Altiarchaeota archaeon]MBU4406743.1 magnesium/cobalt transporter CorA [Candidatus Altiarchaeota archaeon]
MSRIIKRRSKKAGLPPGTLVHVGKKRAEKAKITILDYDGKNFEERVAKRVEDCFPFKDKPTVTWINIDGLHDIKIIEKIGKHFGLHPLLLEDILNTGQRPKMEDFESHIFVVLKMLYHDKAENEVRAEQVSIVLGENFVISFQEGEGDVFDTIRERIRGSKGRIRKAGPDYLAYSLMDAIIDNYFIILERLGDRIGDMEDEVVDNPSKEALRNIHHVKGEMVFLRKSVWPLREVISGLERTESRLIDEKTNIYLRDVYDHTVQIIDTIESLRDTVSGIRDTYMSSISNRMNEVMKVLTIFASIFIPLTFIAGVYGMNFEYIPELGWHWGYFAVWAVMISAAMLMLLYFRRKGWL